MDDLRDPERLREEMGRYGRDGGGLLGGMP